MSYFRVPEKRFGTTSQVFTVEDPHRAGYRGEVEAGVSLDYDLLAVHSWPDGAPAPEACLGRDPHDPTHYKVFKYGSDRASAGFDPVEGRVYVVTYWNDFSRLHLIP